MGQTRVKPESNPPNESRVTTNNDPVSERGGTNLQLPPETDKMGDKGGTQSENRGTQFSGEPRKGRYNTQERSQRTERRVESAHEK